MSRTSGEFARLLAENEDLIREKVAVYSPSRQRVYKASYTGGSFTESRKAVNSSRKVQTHKGYHS